MPEHSALLRELTHYIMGQNLRYKVLKYIKNGQCLHGSGVKNPREAALEVIVNFFLVLPKANQYRNILL